MRIVLHWLLLSTVGLAVVSSQWQANGSSESDEAQNCPARCLRPNEKRSGNWMDYDYTRLYRWSVSQQRCILYNYQGVPKSRDQMKTRNMFNSIAACESTCSACYNYNTLEKGQQKDAQIGGISPEKLALIEKLIQDEFIPINNIPGTSLSIVLDGETILSKGYGLANIERKVPATGNTLYNIGSISKSFMATLVVKTLSEKYPELGESVLDRPIASFKTGFNFTFSDRARAESVSFRDLLSHRTCLVDSRAELAFGSVNTDREYNYRTRYQQEGCGHRAGFIYNNALYALAGDIIAHMNGVTLHELVRRFFKTIGMHSSTTIDESGSYEDLPNMSTPYYRKDGQTLLFNKDLIRQMHMALGAGGVLSTSTDMATYMKFHLNEGRVGSRQVVKKEAMSWLYTPAWHLGFLRGKSNDGDDLDGIGTYAYGLAFSISLYDGYRAIHHEGFRAPFHSQMFLFPEKKLGIFTTANGPGVLAYTTLPNTKLVVRIFDIITNSTRSSSTKNIDWNEEFPPYDVLNAFGNNYTSYPTEQDKDNEYERRTLTNSNPRIEDVIGVYGHESVGDLVIKLDPEDNKFLEMNLGKWGIGRLVPELGSKTKFDIQWKTEVLQTFYALNPVLPVFKIDLKKLDQNIVLFTVDTFNHNFAFKKNENISTFPEIPWSPTSCVPIPTPTRK